MGEVLAKILRSDAGNVKDMLEKIIRDYNKTDTCLPPPSKDALRIANDDAQRHVA